MRQELKEAQQEKQGHHVAQSKGNVFYVVKGMSQKNRREEKEQNRQDSRQVSCQMIGDQGGKQDGQGAEKCVQEMPDEIRIIGI